MTSVTPKSRTLANGTANDAAPVEANFTELYNNDSTLATALTAVENGNLITATTLTLNSAYSGSSPSNMFLSVERGTLANTGFRWNESSKVWEVTNDGTNYFAIVNSSPLSRFRGSAIPVYASTTTFSMAYINEFTLSTPTLISKSTSTTVDLTTTGINGIAQSANLTGTISVTSGTNTVTGSSTTFNSDFQVGDVIRTNGGQLRRITNVGGATSITVESNWGSTETGVAYRRGGRAPNTFYNLYAISDGTTPGLIMTTRNVAGSDSLVDMPTGYTLTRQIPFAVRLNASSNMIPWFVVGGWPTQPRIHYNVDKSYVSAAPATVAGTCNVLAGGASAVYAAISLTGFIPPISRVAVLHPLISNAAAFHGLIRQTGSGVNGTGWGSGAVMEGCHLFVPTDASQSIDYIRTNGAGTLFLDVDGFVITEVG